MRFPRTLGAGQAAFDRQRRGTRAGRADALRVLSAALTIEVVEIADPPWHCRRGPHAASFPVCWAREVEPGIAVAVSVACASCSA